MLSEEDVKFLNALKEDEKIHTSINKEERLLMVEYHGYTYEVPLLLNMEQTVKIEKAAKTDNIGDIMQAVFGSDIYNNFSQVAIEELFTIYQEITEIFNGATLGE